MVVLNLTKMELRKFRAEMRSKYRNVSKHGAPSYSTVLQYVNCQDESSRRILFGNTEKMNGEETE